MSRNSPAIETLPAICSADDCSGVRYRRGFCSNCYYRLRRQGLLPVRTVLDLFEAKVDKSDPNGCWLWTAYRDRDGYGRFDRGRQRLRAHRWSYEHFVGPIPEGLTIDHLCRVRNCVNPDHLEPVTIAENTRRGNRVGWKKTHCKYGHEFTETNTLYGSRGKRICRTCNQERDRRYYWRSRNSQK